MSTNESSTGRPTALTDDELVALVDRTDGTNTANGLPTYDDLADASTLSRGRMEQRLRALERAGRVTFHETIDLDVRTTTNTVAVGDP